MVLIFANAINVTVISLLFALTLKSEITALDQVREANFYLKIFFLIFIFYFLLKKLLKKTLKKENNKDKIRPWNPGALGGLRSFIPIESRFSSAYRYDIDFLLLMFSVFLYLGVFWIIGYANRLSFASNLLILKNAMLILIFYLLFLLANFLFEYEKHLTVKKGKKINTSLYYSYIFFTLIILSGLINYIYEGIKIIAE